MSVRRLAVLGHPVGHSRSPAMQNAALKALGLGEEWRYEAIDLAPENFEARVRAMPAEGFVGANVTIPHKEAALALADAPSHEAGAIGAANTLVFAEDGIEAHNTDAGGLIAALRGAGAAPSPDGGRALVLGAGGAARAAIWALAAEGVSVGVAGVDVWNRTAARAAEIAPSLGGNPLGGGPDQRDYAVIVNTTAVGLRGEDPFEQLPLHRDRFGGGQTFVDMVYGERPSALLAAAAASGAATVDGLEILVQQGALSLQLWTGLEPPLDVMRAAAVG